MRRTNKYFIQELLPHLEQSVSQYLKNELPLTEKDFYGHPSRIDIIDSERLIKRIITDFSDGAGKEIVVSVYMILPKGKYDRAELCRVIRNGMPLDTIEYHKELRGLGNGFYATLNLKGKILESEYD